MIIRNHRFSTNLASFQNGAPQFIKIGFFEYFLILADTLHKLKPKTEDRQSIGSSLRDSGRANEYTTYKNIL